MTFLHDQIQDKFQPEAHPPARMLAVSVTMVVGALGLMVLSA